MNRATRRAHLALHARPQGAIRNVQSSGIEDLFAAASAHYRHGELAEAARDCRVILAREPNHAGSLVLLGGMAREEGRNKVAVKLLAQALALDPGNAIGHDHLAAAYEALGQRDNAVKHFMQAIALGLRDVELLVRQNSAVAASLSRLHDAWPRRQTLDELLGNEGQRPIANDALLLSLLRSQVIRDIELERLLTAIRRAVLQSTSTMGADGLPPAELPFLCALAQQCFINEYLYSLDDAEQAQARALRDRVMGAIEFDTDIPATAIIVTAAYFPLHTLPHIEGLMHRAWPDEMSGLLQQQISEPLAEMSDRAAIPALTGIDHGASAEVQRQYEENPYPRWVVGAPVRPVTFDEFYRGRLRQVPSFALADVADILVAGCGTGSHSIDTARRFPTGRVLAVDLSRASLAYARRKTRELGVNNVEYAQADIAKIAGLDRRFDLIESVGVLHHMADPAAGWRGLLSLLRPGGVMVVGLYSVLARRQITAIRALIAERGFPPTPDGIRACREELLRRGEAPGSIDFFSVSGFRDFCFNAVEHQFSIPEIASFLEANRLTFLGFEVEADTFRQFQQRFPEPAAVTELRCWDAFEREQPRTFANMYLFWIRKPL